MNKKLIWAMVIVVGLLVGWAVFVISCGSSGGTAAATTTTTASGATTTTTTTSTTGTTLSGSTISGTVQVPSSAVSSFSILGRLKALTVRSAATTLVAPPSGTTVQFYDPITEQLITDIPTASVASDGSYTANIPSAYQGQDLLIKAICTSDDNTLIIQGLGAAGETALLNPEHAMAWNKIKEEMAKKSGNLLTQASTLPAATKAEMLALMESLYETVPNIIGTIDDANMPTFTYNNSGKTMTQIEKEMFEGMATNFNAEYNAADDTYKTQFSGYLVDFQTTVSTLATDATYPSGVEIDGSYSGFTMPPIPGLENPQFSNTTSDFWTEESNQVTSQYSGASYGPGCVVPSGGTPTSGQVVFESGVSPEAGLELGGNVAFGDGFVFGGEMNQVVYGEDFVFDADVQAMIEAGDGAFQFGENANNATFSDYQFAQDGADFGVGFEPPTVGATYPAGWQPPAADVWAPPTDWTPPDPNFQPPQDWAGQDFYENWDYQDQYQTPPPAP